MSEENKSYIQELLDEWDEVYKRGSLALWVMIALADDEKYTSEIQSFIEQSTNGNFTVREQSLYRALRRFEKMKVIRSEEHDSPHGGVMRKYYTLTEIGEELLKGFVNLHIEPLHKPAIRKIINPRMKGKK